MNERIQALSEQANAWYPMGYPSGEGGDAAWENVVIFEKEDLKKFAELIVADAIGVLQKRFMGDLNREDMEVLRCIDDLKKHFGVEK